jgi:hypothetical protein
LLPQGVRSEVPAKALQPALLPRPGMHTSRSSLASRTAPGKTASSSGSESPTRGGPTGAPRAGQGRVANRPQPGRYPRAWSRGRTFFSPHVCDRPGCHDAPRPSSRVRARYCSQTCRQAVHNVRDRERKWRSRGTLDGRRKRAYEYQAARLKHVAGNHRASTLSPQPKPRE